MTKLTHSRILPSRLAMAIVLLAAAAAACSSSPSPSPRPSAPASTPSVAPTTAATAGGPGSIVVQPCPTTAALTLCLGQQAATISIAAKQGARLTLSITVSNPGGTSSSPVAVLLYELDATSPLPLGQPACTTCSSTTGRSLVGLEWPALAPGEHRKVTVEIPITGAAGNSVFFADLYSRPLADVMADEVVNGVTPGQTSWKVALTVTSP